MSPRSRSRSVADTAGTEEDSGHQARAEQCGVVRTSLCRLRLPNRKHTGLFDEDVARCRRSAISRKG